MNTKRAELINEAENLAGLGIPVVATNGKRPIGGIYKATLDPSKIQKQFSGQSNVTGVTAHAIEGGCVVLDVDGEVGFESLVRLQEETGLKLDVPTCHSGSGDGAHLWYLLPNGAEVKQGPLTGYPGLELKMWVVVPPSIHPDTQEQYQWETSLAQGARRELPEAIVELAAKRERLEVESTGEIPKGTRNDTLYRLGCSMRGNGVGADVIREVLGRKNRLECVEPLPDVELNRIVESVLEHRPGLTYTDSGNAQRLVNLHGDRIIYVEETETWHVWTGKVWRADNRELTLVELGKDTADHMIRDAARINSTGPKDSLLVWARKSLNRSRIHNAIELARSIPEVRTSVEQLDREPWLLNVQNGTLNLKTGELRPHRKDDYLTHILGIEYNPDAQAPRWEQFIEEITEGNENLAKVLQYVVGSALAGVQRDHKLVLFYGDGANGKTTFLETIQKLLGPYATSAETETFMKRGKQRSVRNDIADLKGARLVTTPETEEGETLAEVTVKELTGGDTIKARHLYKDYFEFKPQFTLVLRGNHLPTIHGSDHAIWRRIYPVPFPVQIPVEQQDPELQQKLLGELPGILTWAVEGCLGWQEEGLPDVPEVAALKDSYRQEQDHTERFIRTGLVKAEEGEIQATRLYEGYADWCGGQGVSPKSRTAFFKKLSGDRRFRKLERRDANYYAGWRLKVAKDRVREAIG